MSETLNQVQAHDNRRDAYRKFDSASVRITITPLLGPPQFTTEYIEVEVNINANINSTIYTVRATDADLRVCTNLYKEFYYHANQYYNLIGKCFNRNTKQTRL